MQSRRGLIRLGGAGLLSLIGGPALARVRPAPRRRLSFLNLHTGERAQTTYWVDGVYQAEALHRIDFVLRDHRTGEVSAIDPRLLDLLFKLQAKLESNVPFHVISGYRSPRSNAMLADRSRGVARGSLHMHGMAIDVRLPNRSLADLREAAMTLQSGGVGYYPESDFVHVDIGRVRRW
jgi:uncharacterized protein YcbK (DUF882 family)